MVKGASAKRWPLPWRAGGKKQPVSPGAAYRAASTNSESPYWRRGVVLPQDFQGIQSGKDSGSQSPKRGGEGQMTVTRPVVKTGTLKKR